MATLPIKTSTDDVEAVISYLKTKATGATLTEAKAALGARLFDGRKLAAYEQWGFVYRDQDKLRLSDAGRELSRASEAGKQNIYRSVIRTTVPYQMAVEWLFHKNISSVTNVEVAAHWHDHIPDQLGTSAETTIRDQVLCFFSLASAAGLGQYILGRTGKPTRLEVSTDALGQFIGEAAMVEDTLDQTEDDLNTPAVSEPEELGESSGVEPAQVPTSQPPAASPLSPEPTRVFISHSKNMDIVDQVKTMLEYTNLDFEVAEEEETTAIPVPDKVFGAMRRCNSAVICVTADDQLKNENGSHAINQNVLIEIGAAFVLYDRKVVLVWDRRLTVPSNLQGLYRCDYDGNELSWSNGMKFMKGVNNFKKIDKAAT